MISIGISPADAYVNFVPGHEYVIDYSITSYKPFEFYTEGSFSEYTRVETISQSDSRGHFRVYLTLPDDYDPPGKHRMYVAAKEKAMPGTVNTIAAIRGFIEVDVPFPGYYAEMDVYANDVNEGEPVKIDVIVRNKGKLNISDAKIHLAIIADGKEIKTMDSESFGIETNGAYTFKTTISGNELKPGSYQVRTELSYAEKTKESVVDFRVGTFDVTIVNYTRSMFNNSVNPFEIEIESLWNNRIDTVFMDILIKDGDKVLSSAKTPPFDLLPWQRKKSSFYWNTEGIPLGNYDLEITLHYGDKLRTENRKIYIVEKQAPEKETPIPVATIILLVIAIMLIVFNIYFITKGRKDKEKGKEKGS